MESGKTDNALRFVLYGFAFSLPLSISISEPLLFVAVALWITAFVARKRSLVGQSPFLLPIVLFATLVLISALGSERTIHSLSKCHRVVFILLFFVVADAFRYSDRSMRSHAVGLALAYVAGCSILSVHDIVRVPLAVSRGVALFETGNMRDPQMYLVAFCFLLAGWGVVKSGKGRWLCLIGLILAGSGLLLHFKRGAWLATILAVVMMSAASRRWKMAVGITVCALTVLMVPQVRERLGELRSESTVSLGGRYVLWTEVAPHILRDHPLGMGWRAVQHEDLRSYSHHIQYGLDHLHNNALQLALEVGWLSVPVWVLWMLLVWYVLWKASRRVSEAAGGWLAVGAIGGFTGLMANGMVEYNFGDSEILMLLALLGGIAGLFARYRPSQMSASPSS